MSRVSNWPSLLAAHLEAARGEAFEWGRLDCCRFAANWVLSATGRDPMKGLRNYRSPEGAFRRAKGDLAKAIADGLEAAGFAEIAPSFAQRGDVAVLDYQVDERFNALVGIVAGADVAVVGSLGLAFEPPSSIRRAWRI